MVMISPNNHTLTSMYESKGKIVKNRERAWQKFRKAHQWMTYKKERNRYNKLLQFQKKQSIIHNIMDNQKNTKGLFRLMNKLTNNTKGNTLPDKPKEVLAEEFATYFLEKMEEVHQHKTISTRNQRSTPIQMFCTTHK